MVGAVLVVLRIVALAGERVAFHGLGQHRRVLPTALIAYGGAGVCLWLLMLFSGDIRLVGPAFWTGAVYAVAFGLYTGALAEGPVSTVSPWANATTVLLFLISPTGGWLAWVGLALFSAGALWLTEGGIERTRAVFWMLASDVFLAAGRLLDARHMEFSPLSYAASVFLAVTLWLAVIVTIYGQWDAVRTQWADRRGWSVAASVTNAGSYGTLILLLRWLPPAVVESVSALASVVSTIAGIWWFRELGGPKKFFASVLMAAGSMILIYAHTRVYRGF